MPVTIVMIEDDEGHARLIEKNIRRAGVNNEILTFVDGSTALAYLLGSDGRGEANAGRHLMVLLARIKADEALHRTPVVVLTTTDDKPEIQRCYDLGANVYMTKPVNYESFANAVRQLGLFFSVIQVPEIN